MKILKVTFQNLNSLKGEHQIDFENGLLGEAGIFSITGPTGAGKSTILDAITLALFGKAARYESKPNPGEMMSRGTGECTAEVLFECNQGRYTAKWTLARARKKPEGKLQGSKREIAEATSGKILAEKLREADQVIEDLTGLDYERFLRSVLLAQGRFKEFLDADDNERGDLLEKITGTEIYSKISQQAYAIGAEKNAEIAHAQQHLDGLQLKSQDELAILTKERTENETDLLKLKTTLTEFQKQLHRYQHATQQNKTLEASQQELAQWKINHEAFAPLREQLVKHETTQPLQAALIQRDNHITEHHLLEKQILSITKDVHLKQSVATSTLAATTGYLQNSIHLQSEEMNTLSAAHQKTTLAQKTAHTWLDTHASDKDLETIIPAVRDLGETIRKQHAEQMSQQTQLKKFEQELSQAEKIRISQKRKLTAAAKILTQKQIDQQDANLAFTKAAQQQTIVDWRLQAKSHRTQEEQAHALHSLRQQWLATQKQIRQHQTSYPVLLQTEATAKKSYLNQQTITQQEQATLTDKERIHQQSLRIASLEQQRDQLKLDDACPLCGSTEHPYAEHLQLDENADQSAVQHQKKVLAQAQAIETEHLKKLTESESSLKHYQQKLEASEQTRQQQVTQFATSAEEAQYDTAIEDQTAFEDWYHSRQQQRIQTEAKVESLERLNEQLSQAQQAFKEQTTAHQLIQAQSNHLGEAQEKLLLNIQELTASLQKLKTSLLSQLKLFNVNLRNHCDAAITSDDTRACTSTLENKLQTYHNKVKEFDRFNDKLKEISHQLDRLNLNLTHLKEELTRWSEKLNTFKPPTESPTPNGLSISEQASIRQQVCENAIADAQIARQSLQQKQEDYDTRAQTIKTDTAALNQQITIASIESIDSIKTLKAAQLTPDTFQQLKQQRKELTRQHDTLQGQIKQTQHELKKLAAKTIPTAEEVTTIQEQHETQNKHFDSINQRLGEITLLIEQDSTVRAQQAKQIQQIEKLRKTARPWTELSALIGSASGDKFSKFAQGLTLSQLLQLANRHLIEINDRYQIQRTNENELGLQIIDRYQADAIRPTRSLSGGESFLVSLALALGLSDLAGNNTRIESLFIDEGFGTLDSETLDIALAALENLRMSNRTIGIISHVDALKQRITAQIQVSKANNGYGSLEIINGA